MTCSSTGPLPNTPSFGGHGKGATDRTVKYIANSAAKNISSEDSQTIVPTDTIDGRVTEPCGGAFSRTGAAAATGSFWQTHHGNCRWVWHRVWPARREELHASYQG